MNEKITVSVTEDTVTIFKGDEELVHWVEDEWLEDPSITISIANAIHLAYVNPEYLIEKLNRKEEN